MEETFSDSSGSFRKTIVRPFCFEKTNIINADSLISERVIWRGIVRPEEAARGCGDVNEGLVDKYVFNGLAWGFRQYSPKLSTSGHCIPAPAF